MAWLVTQNKADLFRTPTYASWPPSKPTSSCCQVAAQALSGIETGLHEILADEITRHVKQGLAAASPSAA